MYLRSLTYQATTCRLYSHLDDGRLFSTINSRVRRSYARLLETKILSEIPRMLSSAPYNDQLDNHNGSIRQARLQPLHHLRHRPLRRELHLPLLTNETHLPHVDTSLSTTTHKYAPFMCIVNCRLWLAETVTLTHYHTTY